MPDWAGKLTTPAAAADLVRSGQSIALGGMTLYRRPMGFVRALLRKSLRDLTLISFTGGLESDLLVGAGAVRTVRSCYFGLESFGLAPMFTRAAASGTITLVEETEATLSYALKAAMAGVGFLPARALHGTSIPGVRPDLTDIACPYTGERYVAIPPIRPDVAVVHVPLADRHGNCVLGGEHCVDRELSLASGTVIVTAERIVETSVIEAVGADILGLRVAALVHLPWGAHPTSCWPAYPLDGEDLVDYVEACADGRFAEYCSQATEGGAEGYRARRVTDAMEAHRASRLTSWERALQDLGAALAPATGGSARRA